MNIMKLVIAALIMSLLTFSALAGTFIETFNGANLKEWQELVENDEAPGSWEIVDNELHAISPNGWMRLLTIGDKKWRNYTIEFDVKPLEKHGRGNIAIAARIKKTQLVSWTVGNWLFLEPSAVCRGGNFHDNRTILFHIKSHPPLPLGEWSTLKLTVKDGTYILWINDQKIMETGEPFIFKMPGVQEVKGKAGELFDFPTGGVGFGLSNYTARFDNIVITGDGIPNQGQLLVSPQAKLATTWGNLKRF